MLELIEQEAIKLQDYWLKRCAKEHDEAIAFVSTPHNQGGYEIPKIMVKIVFTIKIKKLVITKLARNQEFNWSRGLLGLTNQVMEINRRQNSREPQGGNLIGETSSSSQKLQNAVVDTLYGVQN